jgi:glycerol-1-phosphate dehydrogenase [NAD(P)+]
MPPRPRQLTVPGLLEVRAGCLDDFHPLLADNRFDLDRPVLVGCGSGPSRVFAARITASLRAGGAEVIEACGLVGRLEQAAAAAATIIEAGVGTAVAVGGGRVLDPVKLAAARTGIDFVSVPTTLSNDGISSPVASLVDRAGVRQAHAARMPYGVVVDLDAVGSAPLPTLRAGVGDLASNLTALLDWRMADRLGYERFDAYSAMIAEAAARPVLDLDGLESAESRDVLAHGLILSGLAMEAAGTSRPCSGAEHLISHALDAARGNDAALHGEQVALGALIAAAAHKGRLHEELRRVFAHLGLPTRPEHIGIDTAAAVEAVLAAPAMRPDRWTVLSDYAGRPAEAAALVERAFDAVPVRGIGVLAAPDGPQSSRRETTRSPAWPSSKRQKVSLNSA